jgi:putative oxidoreductase
MNIVQRLYAAGSRPAAVLAFISPVVDLGVRLWVGNVFWKSGLTKIQSWDTTLYLFSNEYHVPLLSPAVAAVSGAFTELFFPVLLVLGAGGRFAAFVLFVFNLIAANTYPGISEGGIKDHTYWGILLLILLVHGPGKLSIDYWINRRRG